VKRGRPPKPLLASGTEPEVVADERSNNSLQQQKKQSTRNATPTDWASADNFPLLKAAMEAYMNRDTNQDTLLSDMIVPLRTVERAVARIKDMLKGGIRFGDITADMMHKQKKQGLLGESDLKFIEDVIVTRDEANNGMGRGEVIHLISEVSQCSDRIKCKNHWDHLVRSGKMKALKAGGKVKKAQTTTTKITQITVEQQLRWHTTVESGLEESERLNEPRELFAKVKEYFVGNLDESCLMSANGKILVVASAAKIKTEKISDDCRESITTIRTGFTSGHQAAYYFLAKGKELRTKFKNISRHFKAPEGSEVIMTPNAFMTDDAWLQMVPKLCKSIRNMEVIRDHPDWWVLLSLNGFGSHVNVFEAHDFFAKEKILVIKEEGDTSHVNQAYDQQVAKDDKTFMRTAVEALNPVLRQKMDQWYLIVIAIHAQNCIEKGVMD